MRYEKSGGIRVYYEATFADTGCGHAHMSYAAAEKCAAATIRAALRGVKFGHPADSDWIAKNYTPECAEGCVTRHTVGI